jgi:hypothetical protein
MSQQGLRLIWDDLGGSNVDLETFVGGADYYFSTPLQWLGDGYWSARLDYSSPDFALGGNYLITGVGAEEGWSVDLWAKFWGNRELAVEYARMVESAYGDTLPWSWPSDPEAWCATVDLWKGANWSLSGFYSDVDADFNPFYSSVNPYFESYGISDMGFNWLQWGRYLDNPLALPNLEVLGGELGLMWGNTDLMAGYYVLDSNSGSGPPAGWRNTPWGFMGWDGSEVPYDKLLKVALSKEVAEGLDFQLIYGRQWFNEDAVGGLIPGQELPELELDDVDLLMARVTVGF